MDPQLVYSIRKAIEPWAVNDPPETYLKHQPYDTLESWHEQYSAVDGDDITFDSDVIQDVLTDTLDYDEVERQVQRLQPSADVVQGFCARCRHLLEHWPDMGWETEDKSPACAVGRLLSTHEIEAAARAGCRFCAFLLSSLKSWSLLDIFRKIEVRLRDIGDIGTASLSIEVDRPESPFAQSLWLNPPGKIATYCCPRSFCLFRSNFISPTGELQILYSLKVD